VVVWDSLAILEHLAQTHASLWPQAVPARAMARSICAEMRSGFAALRSAMPMNCRASGRRVTISAAVAADIARVQNIWRTGRVAAANHGPWQIGSFTAADAMYAPVVSRFHTNGVAGDAVVTAYVQTVLNDPCVQQWSGAGHAETEFIAEDEVGAA
jgi:glutathione S-transferase